MKVKTCIKFSITLVGVSIASGQAFGQGMAYGVDAGKKLWLFDMATASSTLIGDVGITAQSLGFSSSGGLYATASNGFLYSISMIDASATAIGHMGIGIVASMDWDSTNSRMLVGDFSSAAKIYSVDLATAATTLVTTSTTSATSIQTLVTRDGSSVLDVRYSSGAGGSFGNRHATLDTGTGTFSPVTGVFSDFSAMDRGSDGLLYGLSKIGRLVKIDPTDGSEVDIGLVNGGVAFTGMTAVPEPTSLIAIGLGAALLLRRRAKV